MDIKILVVDDSASDRLIIEKLLHEYTVVHAADGIEAFEQIERHPDIDLVILDLNMPRMSGFDVLSAFQTEERYKRLRTIILTNFDELGNEVRGLRSGAVDFIRKPIQMESLKARIDIHSELIRIQRVHEQILKDQDLTFDTLFNEAPIGIAISYNEQPISDDSCLDVKINPMYERITGRLKEELIRLGWAAITHPDDLAEDLRLFRKIQAGEIEHYAVDKRYIKPDGSIVWVHMVVAPLNLSSQMKPQHITLIQDITLRKETEKALAESERSKSVLLSHLPGLAYRCHYDRDWTMRYVSAGCLELTGYPPEYLVNNERLSFNDLIAPEYRDLLQQEWKRILAERLPFSYEYEIITAAGERKWVLELGQGIFDERGTVEALEGIILDISERKQMEDELRYTSEHDLWTGLYNRSYLEQQLLNDSKSHIHKRRALVGINVSPLFRLNMVYGFYYTWSLIKKIADALNAHCNDGRLLFSMYENQFAFYIKGYEDQSELEKFCEAIAQTLKSFLTIERIDTGIGVVEINERTDEHIDQLFKNLLIASEKALDDYNDYAFVFFDDEMEAASIREDEIKRELAQIAAGDSQGNLFVLFQPILDLKTRRIYGFEALARLRSDHFGLLSPVEFIPIAEETKYIIPLGDSIIRQAFHFLNQLRMNGHDSMNVSINISAVQLLRSDFKEKLFKMIKDMKVQPENLTIEITESILFINYQEINSILGELKQSGIQIAIDDFGTGYSSLSRERELNVNVLKIDKSFIDKLLLLQNDQAITSDIISMAHKLGHSVVAEGVEHEGQRRYLERHGCDRIQGYLISRPVDSESAIALLDRQF